MDIILASQNQGKIIEFESALKPHTLIAKDIEVAEVGLSFHENALLKARACASDKPGIYIGDDSGVMIDCINGMPGIHSKRWKGSLNANDAIQNVLKDLVDYPDYQAAQMVCVIALIKYKNDPLPTFFVGMQHGEFHKVPKGKNGFAYDPYFYTPNLGKTNGQLSLEDKNTISHRGGAIRMLVSYVSTLQT